MTDFIQAGEISGTYRPPNHSSITGGNLPRKRTQARAKAAGRTPAKPGALPVRSMPALRGRFKMGDDLQSEVRRSQLLQSPADPALLRVELVSGTIPKTKLAGLRSVDLVCYGAGRSGALFDTRLLG